MPITSMLVLFAVIWFMVLFVVLPLRLQTQADDGEVAPGTPASAPSGFVMKRKFLWTTIVTVVLWAISVAVIMSGAVSLSQLDFFTPQPGG